MSKSDDGPSPRILIDSPEKNLLRNEEEQDKMAADDTTTFMTEISQPTLSKLSSTSMLSIYQPTGPVETHLSRCVTPSTISRLSWGGRSILSFSPNSGNIFLFLFFICFAFISGIIVGGFSVDYFLCGDMASYKLKNTSTECSLTDCLLYNGLNCCTTD